MFASKNVSDKTSSFQIRFSSLSKPEMYGVLAFLVGLVGSALYVVAGAMNNAAALFASIETRFFPWMLLGQLALIGPALMVWPWVLYSRVRRGIIDVATKSEMLKKHYKLLTLLVVVSILLNFHPSGHYFRSKQLELQDIHLFENPCGLQRRSASTLDIRILQHLGRKPCNGAA